MPHLPTRTLSRHDSPETSGGKIRFPLGKNLASLGLGVALIFAACGCNHMTSYVNNRAGYYRYRYGQYDQAREEFERALANNPRNPDYYHNLAASSSRSGDVAAAEQYYYQALSLDPTHQPSYHNLALLLQESGRENDAGKLLQGWADTQPDSSAANVELAWFRKNRGDIQGAEQALTQALQVDPKSHIAAAKLGELYQEQGRPSEALALYERSMHLRWDQPQVQSRIAGLKSTYPGTNPDDTFVTRLISGSSTQTVNLPGGTGVINTVSAFPLPRFQPDLWNHSLEPSTSFSTGSTFVRNSESEILPVVTSRPVMNPTPLLNSDPVHPTVIGTGYRTTGITP